MASLGKVKSLFLEVSKKSWAWFNYWANYSHIAIFAWLRQWLSGKISTCSTGDAGDMGLIPGSGRYPGGRPWQPTPVLPEKFHGQRSLAGYSLKSGKEWLSTHAQPFFFFGHRIDMVRGFRLGSLELGSAKSFPLNTGLRKILGWSPKKNAEAVSRWMESSPKGTSNHRCVLWGPTRIWTQVVYHY